MKSTNENSETFTKIYCVRAQWNMSWKITTVCVCCHFDSIFNCTDFAFYEKCDMNKVWLIDRCVLWIYFFYIYIIRSHAVKKKLPANRGRPLLVQGNVASAWAARVVYSRLLLPRCLLGKVRVCMCARVRATVKWNYDVRFDVLSHAQTSVQRGGKALAPIELCSSWACVCVCVSVSLRDWVTRCRGASAAKAPPPVMLALQRARGFSYVNPVGLQPATR